MTIMTRKRKMIERKNSGEGGEKKRNEKREEGAEKKRNEKREEGAEKKRNEEREEEAEKQNALTLVGLPEVVLVEIAKKLDNLTRRSLTHTSQRFRSLILNSENPELDCRLEGFLIIEYWNHEVKVDLTRYDSNLRMDTGEMIKYRRFGETLKQKTDVHYRVHRWIRQMAKDWKFVEIVFSPKSLRATYYSKEDGDKIYNDM